MVTVNSEDCATEYQAALQQVLDLKETCNGAVYKDCCEVRNTAINLDTVKMNVCKKMNAVAIFSHKFLGK
jgi:hypothetical protein